MLFSFSDSDIKALDDLHDAMDPLEIAINMLGTRGRDLIGAETVYSYIYNLLDKQSTEIARKLKMSFMKRIKERRNATLVHLLLFLKDPSYWSKERDFFGEEIVKEDIKSLATELVSRLFPDDISSHGLDVDEDNDIEFFKVQLNKDNASFPFLI